MEFNRIIKLLRKERGITQKQAAEDLGVATAGTNFCWCCPAFRETFCKPNWNRSALPRRWHPYPAIRISVLL